MSNCPDKQSFEDIFDTFKNCLTKLESDIKIDIINASNLMKSNDPNMEEESKNKDYHLRKIIQHFYDIKDLLLKISYHKNMISSNQMNAPTEDSYVKKQIRAFSNEISVEKRDLLSRRNRSSFIYSAQYLNAWEKLLQENSEEGFNQDISIIEAPKRNKNSIRKKKKFVSSTFQDFLEEDYVPLDSVKENDLEENSTEQNGISEEIKDENKLNNDIKQLTETENKTEIFCDKEDDVTMEETKKNEHEELGIVKENEDGDDESNEDEVCTKPRIIDVIFKKPNNDYDSENRTEDVTNGCLFD